MELKFLEISYHLYKHVNELDKEDQHLIRSAQKALIHAYAPYSGYHVGCSISLANGAIILGNNQENRSFPVGLCAESNAFYHAGKEGKAHLIRKIAIVGKGSKNQDNAAPMPCGSCRQVMLEYEQIAKVPFQIFVLNNENQVYRFEGVEKSLLPFSFNAAL